jgi:hypothetical protein
MTNSVPNIMTKQSTIYLLCGANYVTTFFKLQIGNKELAKIRFPLQFAMGAKSMENLYVFHYAMQ